MNFGLFAVLLLGVYAVVQFSSKPDSNLGQLAAPVAHIVGMVGSMVLA